MSIINELDVLAPFEIWEVLYGNQSIKFNTPLSLKPMRVPDDPDEPSEQEYYQVVYPQLAIDVFAENREELLEAVHSCIRMNWKHYVQKDDSRLSPQTQAIKLAFLAVAEIVDE